MVDKHTERSDALIHLAPDNNDSSLLINKKCTTVDELRRNFKSSPNPVLAKVRSFLPQMAAANDELKSKMESEPNFSADIEQIDEQSPYIQMDLALFEQSDSDCTDSDSDGSEDDIELGKVTEHNIKLPYSAKTSNKPLIQTLKGDGNTEQTGSKSHRDLDETAGKLNTG